MKYSELREKMPRAELKNAVPLRAPFTVFIEPTNICNFRCEMCPHQMKDYASQAGYHQLMDLKLFNKLITEIAAFGGCKVIRLFFDGESLIHPDIGYMMRTAKSVADRVELLTNGSLLTAEKAQSIIDAKVDYVRVSIYGVSQENHERVTGNKNHKFNVNMIRDNVARLHRMRTNQDASVPFIAVNMLHNVELEALRAAYAEIVDDVSTAPLHSWGSDFVNISNLIGSSKMACPSPFYILVIRADGSVVPCCVAWSKELIMGNVNSNTLLEIWNGEKFEALRKAHLHGNRQSVSGCKDCTMLFDHDPRDFVDGLTVEEYEARHA